MKIKKITNDRSTHAYHIHSISSRKRSYAGRAFAREKESFRRLEIRDGGRPRRDGGTKVDEVEMAGKLVATWTVNWRARDGESGGRGASTAEVGTEMTKIRISRNHRNGRKPKQFKLQWGNKT